MIAFHNFPPKDATDAYVSEAGRVLLDEMTKPELRIALGSAVATELIDVYKDKLCVTVAAGHILNSLSLGLNPNGIMDGFEAGLLSTIGVDKYYSRDRKSVV